MGLKQQPGLGLKAFDPAKLKRRESDFRGNFFHGDFFPYGFVRFVEDQGLLFESGDQNTVAGIERCGEYPPRSRRGSRARP